MEQIAAESASLPGTGAYMLRFIAAVLLVCVLAVATTRLLGNKLAVRTGGRLIRIVDSTPVGRNKWLCVTRIGTRSLLLGVTDHSINVLTELKDQDLVREPEPEREGTSFFDRLVQAVQGQRHREE